MDASGNVYVTGNSNGNATGSDYATVKYNSAGVPQWVQRYNGPGNGYDSAVALAVDASGNVFVTGGSDGGSVMGSDYATIKYNSAGVAQWAQRYNGPGNNGDSAYALVVDASGNVYVTGLSNGGATGGDYATIKYNAAGVPQWVARYNNLGNGYDEADALAMDASGNVYVTGYSYGGAATSSDYATIKYNASGIQQWVARYNGPNSGSDNSNAIAVDASGNVYVTGYSDGGSSSASNNDYATIKYNSAGVQQWVARYNGVGNDADSAYAIAVDAIGNVYVAGGAYGGATSADYVTIKYSENGVPQWAQRYNGPGNKGDGANALAVDASGNVYVTGSSYDSGTSDDYATIKYAAPRWMPVDVGVNRTDNTSRLLWRETTNRYALWKVSSSGGVQIGKHYGPVSGYACEEIAVAPNGQTTLLWKYPAKRIAAIWTIAADLSTLVKATTYSYPAGYTPSHLAADADSNVRLSWRKMNGAVAFWTVVPATGAVTKSAVYGPYASLVDGPLAVGPDGNIRFVWRNVQTGGATVWTIPTAYGTPSAGYNYNPVAGAVPYDISVGADNKTRLQWAYTSGADAGKIAVWKINTTIGGTGAVEIGKFFGPLAGVFPLGLSVGGDNQTRQLWQYTTGSAAGKAALWVLNDPLTSITSAYTYGPLP